MPHHTKDKGDLAVAFVIADLSIKNYSCFIPVISEHLPFDLIAYKNNQSFRLQVKYSCNGFIKNKTSWSDKNGTHTRYYDKNDFDYYAIYSPVLNKVLYPSVIFGGKKISYSLPNSASKFFWFEDFLDFTDYAEKKNYQNFNFKITRTNHV